jgi:glycosyltransferase involved in cell wall biosynthesis
MYKLCLSMIVKNESHIILECLNSVWKEIDYWVIVDTGSTDNTKEIITNFFKEKNIPGELHERPWIGFGHNRTEALDLCKGKAQFAFMIDADDYLVGSFKLTPDPNVDGYIVKMGREEFSWWRSQIFNLQSNWKYVGVLHEYATCEKQQPILVKINGDYRVVARTEGARNIGISPIEKYSRDAITLEKALETEPENARYQFYLAQSYFDSQQWEKAEQAYKKRADMGGWDEEIYYSLYRVAIAMAMQNKPWEDIQQAFLDAYNSRPIRAEPLFHIAQIYRTKFNKPALGYLFAKMAAEIPFPANDILFVPDIIYKFAILDEIAATAYYAGQPLIGHMACKKLLSENRVPQSELQRIQDNYRQYEKIIENMKNQMQNQMPQAQMKQEQPHDVKKKKKYKERK